MTEPGDIQYDAPQYKYGAGAKLDMIDTQGKDPKHFVQKTKSRFDASRQDRKPHDTNWDRYRRYYGGDHWFNKMRPAYKARPAPNYVFADIESIIPAMTSRRPTINVVGKTEKDAKTADLMQDAVRSVFLSNEMDVREVYVLKDAHIYGTGITKQHYDPKTRSVKITPIDTRNFFVAPGATDLQKARYVQIALERLVVDMEADFPHLKDKIGPGNTSDSSLAHKPVTPNKLYGSDSQTVINADTGEMMGASGGEDDETTKKKAIQIEEWSRDGEGQVWLTIICGDQLAQRRPSPFKNGLASYPGGSKYPFARCLCYPINSQFWGMGEVAQLESPQDMVNRSEAQIADLARLCTSPYMLLHRQSRVSLKDITNRIASFIVWDGDVPPSWMQPPGVASALFEISDRSKKHMDNMSSVQDAYRGEMPSDRTSGVAINRLQEASAGRIALKTRMFESYLVEVGNQVIDLIKQYFQNTVVRTQGGFKPINKISLDPMTQQAVVDPVTDVTSCDYTIEIGVGSTLPVDKGIRNDQALNMFTAGAISRKTLLSRTGWTEEEIVRAQKEYDDEKLHDADIQIKLKTLDAAMQQSVQPPDQGAASDGSGAPPPSDPGSGGGSAKAELDGIKGEMDQLEGGQKAAA